MSQSYDIISDVRMEVWYMKILVINGSPKGHNSITLQTVLYLEMLHP